MDLCRLVKWKNTSILEQFRTQGPDRVTFASWSQVLRPVIGRQGFYIECSGESHGKGTLSSTCTAETSGETITLLMSFLGLPRTSSVWIASLYTAGLGLQECL